MDDSENRYIPTSVPPISDKALDEFIAIYKKEFKEDISRIEAREMASNLLRLHELLSRKPPRSLNEGSS